MFEIKCQKCGNTTELTLDNDNRMIFDNQYQGGETSIFIDIEDWGNHLSIECRNCKNELKENYC